MILAALCAGALAGLDNLQACASVGLLPLSSRVRVRLALAFSACEIAAPMIGLLMGQVALTAVGRYARIAGPVITIVCGAIFGIPAPHRTRGQYAITVRSADFSQFG
jgi:putative Mn2+ efflux pump MntP